MGLVESFVSAVVVLELRMKPFNNPLMSYEEISQRLRISPTRVRQIERQALDKLRKGLLRLGVKGLSSETSGGDVDN